MIDYATEIKERLDTAEVLEVYGIHIDRREVIRMCTAEQISRITRRAIKSRYDRQRAAVMEELNRLPLSGKRKYKCYILLRELGFAVSVATFENPIDGAQLCIIRDGICHIFFDEKKPLNIAFPIGARQSEAKTPKSKEAPNVKVKAEELRRCQGYLSLL